MANQKSKSVDAELNRLRDESQRKANWKRWGPYLAERQWGTVREDYSADGACWDSFPHEHARSRAYRWGEDGLLGITDRECRLCLALALWNGNDGILKERLFGLTGPQGNHGEDVKECYYYLDSTPTHSYMKALYKYPQAAYPYADLVAESARRDKSVREYELCDTGVFEGGRYFDVQVEYAKGGPNDMLAVVTVTNRGPDAAPLHLLPTLWFRNTWIWGCAHEGCTLKPRIERLAAHKVSTEHESLGRFHWDVAKASNGVEPTLLFTENETNTKLLYGVDQYTPYVRDAFYRYVIDGDRGAVRPEGYGTKVAAYYQFDLAPGEAVSVRLRLTQEDEVKKQPFGSGFSKTFDARQAEADAFYDRRLKDLAPEQRGVARQGYAGLLWTKQFYHYIVEDWLEGDPASPKPPASRMQGRNHDWRHLFNRDVISMPDSWEYPWYAAWDLAFHMIPFSRIDPWFTKKQLMLFMREWYMHPNGQIPAYEFNFSDVNPPVHAWACWRVFKMTAPRGKRDRAFLASTFQKLLLNFTWWVNRKDPSGEHLFSGGFLGLDNIGVFDRSQPLPQGGSLQQADGTAWMAFYCATMMSMALELAQDEPGYEDMASKFFEHFVAIADAMNTLGGSGLWLEEDGFYYDQMRIGDQGIPLRVRSLVGLMPLIAVEVLEARKIDKLKGFRKRMDWFLKYRSDLAQHITYMACDEDRHGDGEQSHYLLAIPSRERLERVLHYMLDENEFLSPFGIRSMSKYHEKHPFELELDGKMHSVRYVPAESDTYLFGGNSNWRGPIWFPTNYLLIEALQRYHHFYGDSLQVECPTGSGNMMTLDQVAQEIAHRLSRLFLADEAGRRPCHHDDPRYRDDPHWKDLVLFYEYFDGDNGRGVGASHQTGWTALAINCMEKAVQ